MRLYKTVAQIFLILSILNFTFAGIAFFSQTPTTDEMRVDLGPGAEDVTVASSEKGHTQSEELPEWLGRPESTAGNLHSRGRLLERQLVNADDLEKDKFFSPELNRKMKEYLILGSIAGLFTGVANGMQKEIIGTVSPNSYVLFFLCPPPLLPTLEWREPQTYSDHWYISVKRLGVPLNLWMMNLPEIKKTWCRAVSPI